jgi:hypothetical protein
MRRARGFRAFWLVAVALAVSHSSMAQTDDLVAIQQKLNSQFKVTTITADRSDIVTAGDVVVIHKPGLLMYGIASPLPPSNSYSNKNGKIGQGWNGFGKDMLISMGTPGGGTAADYPHRQFEPEEKCWITGIQAQKDGILIQLYSDPYDNVRYYANLKIPFPNKKIVPPADSAMQLVADVVSVVPQEQSVQEPAPIQAAVAPPAVPAPMPDIAPPPPPTDAPPPTISLGDSMDQVTAGFGQPLKVGKLGTKTIFYYKDMKVTFTGKKVSNVE